MPSQLNGKTNEYAIENGISFDEAYTFPPTQTGTVTDTNAANWQITGRNPVYEPTEGPLGGGGSWKFSSDATLGCRFRSNSSTMRALYSDDGSYASGWWVKVQTFNPTAGAGYPVHVVNPLSATPSAALGFQFNCITENTSGLRQFHFFNGNASTPLTSTPVIADQWYFVAIWKSGTTWRYYLNGVLDSTASHNAYASLAGSINWGNIYQGYDTEINMSNWFVQPAATTGTWSSANFDAQVADIWNAGKTRNIKHWTGSEWVNSNGNKVWDGSAWIDIDKEYWDGTAWVAI